MTLHTPLEFESIRDLLRYAVTQFNKANLHFGHGSSNAYDEAAYLILKTLSLPLDQLEPFLDARLLKSECDQILHVIERRIKDRIPAAYLTQEAWLGEYRFYVDERVIVPRSFIAELLQAQLVPWVVEPDRITNILDMCTGSGCLAILSALYFEYAQIDAVDISKPALEVAHKNIDHYGLEKRIDLIASDLFSSLKNKRYDLIISNPPYVNAESMSQLPREYQHEPQNALSSGIDGLDATRKILESAAEHLTEDGLLVVEIGHNREALEHAYPSTAFNWLETHAGNEFVFLLHRNQLPSNKNL
ncbi:MAG TPA: 50S ribosomal protein L3 N(5)-glutamine methyltransferase [Nitrosomonas sp.]|nr:50S ribosomal protein L3 N(5)-glutamine methyltransferase [Nitrosomonas sp.]HQX14450.1 50S ribosomal protein L3 N(5)-glutamine methyltransferase [Nitrosomonas sp.]HRB33088.1 50S ribosomal protein L3 N(5)-glutamine methyltransferase [Nitrosomonas sp.]HRB46575.1 50S ribosomal protein L3 N(5)-glutamine methyltransferase [Nitrosomonas sp.]HRB78320.1 50S ribosomal protein L3 N(5)-glutamine methyltransferase [Nitrosomonas sp.]